MTDAPDPSDAAGEGGAADTADAPLDPAQDAPAAPKKKMSLRRVARWTAAVLGAPVLLAAVIVFAPFGYLVAMGSGQPPATIAATGGDGLWIGHMWVDGREDEANVTELAATVKADGIKDVFVHDGPLNDDGTLPVQLDPKAAWFVATFRKDTPGVRVQAWHAPAQVPIDLGGPDRASGRDDGPRRRDRGARALLVGGLPAPARRARE